MKCGRYKSRKKTQDTYVWHWGAVFWNGLVLMPTFYMGKRFTSAATSLDTQKRNSTVCKVFYFPRKTPHKYIVMYYYHYIEQRPNPSCQRASEILNLFRALKKKCVAYAFT